MNIQPPKDLSVFNIRKTLMYYDGPIVSLLTDDAGNRYVLFLIDCEGSNDVWLLVDNPKNVQRYLDSSITALELWKTAQGLYRYDTNHHLVRTEAFGDLDRYHPLNGSYLPR